jgi:hypothetical protein
MGASLNLNAARFPVPSLHPLQDLRHIAHGLLEADPNEKAVAVQGRCQGVRGILTSQP